MYYKQELKAALKKLKSKNDFTYQAGVNDALDLLDEMEEFIVLENSTQELTQENTQKDKVETFEEKERASSSVLPPDFSELKQLAQELIDAPIPESIDLEIPDISSTISDEELMFNSKSNEKTPSINEPPTFKGWSEPQGTEESEATSKTEEIIKENFTFDKAQEVSDSISNIIEAEFTAEPRSVIEETQKVDVTVDSEEQEKLKKAQLLAESRAQALAEAEELEEDDDE
ncbi:hypothetical protein RCG33_09280 [Lactococcus lactis]|jgi:hypothetical protein|uniref:Uncharacterized protein n=2 Tax=Lactococcus lactis subsp. lactis TaxID=1360 RepID=S6F7F8_LACLL|nr:hypothetical protein [Lactococcus lactis]MDN6242480.1 hypothetical protein [Tetragenococcus koreensis]MDN6385891.1 hypothetical protein [Alkalibacterium sp.]ARE21595.1 hypothetical protein LLUC06_2053 [Lactococcus lactis subsp. lactis]MDH8062620.1 hypothetical protein [Lactococcus lactis subsp. lactis]MDN5424659.1 hypothetical protein [Lactococcus lactis]